MSSPLDGLGLSLPVLAAPMAGGPTTPALVTAAAGVGSLGFLAGGYLEAEQLSERIATVRAETETFAVNLFAPNPLPIEPAAFQSYASALQAAAEPYGIDLRTVEVREDDDDWSDKIELLLRSPVPVVSFTFGIPDETVIRSLRRAGTLTIQTVTSTGEARSAAEAGVDLLAVQSAAAGGHSGTLTPRRPAPAVPLAELVASIREATRLPIIGAGGVSTALAVSATLAAGADAVMVGTVLLRTEESGASEVHKAALADPDRGPTVVTRAFTGRPARGLLNAFIERYESLAPLGYPAIHHLTSPIRKASVAAGSSEFVNLWAGTGYRDARPGPVGEVLTALAEAP